jgi:protein-S-isoprenylcysteine O-methyltransferase Ste14
VSSTTDAVARHADEVSGVRIPPPLFYLAGLLLGFALELMWPIQGPPPAVSVTVAVAGCLVWLLLDGTAMVSFRRADTSMIPFKPSTALVVTGPYRFTRNPMYVGMAALYLGLAVAVGLIWALILLPVLLVAVDRLVIAREEPYLERRFGEDYRLYKQRVRRWL